MNRLVRLAVAGIAVGALAATVAAPAGAQIPDVPDLGFEIDPLEGPVGSTVGGLVDTDDVAEHCITDPEAFLAQLVDLENPLSEDHPYIGTLIEWVFDTFGEDFQLDDIENDPVQFAIAVALLFPLGLFLDLTDPEGGELVEGALAQTFVMAFADLETASPIEPLGNFDRNTGEGSVDVPELEAGFHPVIATCVGVLAELTTDDIARAIDAGVAFIEANFEPPFPTNVFGEEFAELAGQVAPTMLQELIEPLALGFEFFCVHNDDGECPEEEPPPVDDAPRPAEAVVVEPAFTG